MTSLDDCPRFTWSFGWTGEREPITPPMISMARLDMTSLAFMFVEVPEPVWKMSTTNSESSLPSATSCAAAAMAAEMSESSRPRSAFVCAAASFTLAMARMNDLGNRRSLIGKLTTARIVWAP